MQSANPSPTTLRLLACLDSFAHEEAGTVGHDDWPSLVGILERELLLLRRLAQENPVEDPTLKPRLETLSRRYEHLFQQIEAAKIRSLQELDNLKATRQRVHAVRNAYMKP